MSSSEDNTSTGSDPIGSDRLNDSRPNGGFPPIYLCKQGETEEGKKRQFSYVKDAVSIKDLLGNKNKRRFFS